MSEIRDLLDSDYCDINQFSKHQITNPVLLISLFNLFKYPFKI